MARGRFGKLGDAGLAREAGDLEVAAVDFQEGGGLVRDRAVVVPHVGPVGGPDLDEGGVGLHEDVGDAEAAADLDGLAPRHDDRFAAGDGAQCEHDGRGVVVDRESGLGAGDAAQEIVEVDVA